MNRLRILYHPEPECIQQARERQTWRAQRCNLRRLTWLEAQTAWGAVATDGEVAAWDARVAAAERELMA